MSRWKRTTPRKTSCSESAANASATRSGTVAMHPGVFVLVRLASEGSASRRSSSLKSAAMEEITQPTTGAA